MTEHDLLAASSLGHPEVVSVADAVPDDAVDDVLGRLSRLDKRVAEGRGASLTSARVAAHGPLVEWRREQEVLLRRAATQPADRFDEHLRPVVTGDLPSAEVDRLLLADVELVRALVEAVGDHWADGHHRRLLRAARIQAGLDQPRANARRSVSGFTGASHRSVSPGAVAAPVDTLPVVRGRDALIAWLLATTAEPGAPATVLVGDAGYGKSTAALAVAREARERLLTLWIVGKDGPSLVDGLQQVAARLGVTARDLEVADHADPETHARRLWALIDRRPERWVLVIDDAGPEAVGSSAWLHRPRHGAVLITSRYGDEQAWGDRARVVTMERLAPEHGARLLLDGIAPAGRRLSAAVGAQARRASELLAGMPLALTTVGTLVRSRDGGSLDDVVATLRRRSRAGALETAYETCLDAAGDDAPGVRRLLRLLSCFAPDEPLPLRAVDPAPERDLAGRDGLEVLRRVGLVEERIIDDGPAVMVLAAVAEHSRLDPAFPPDDVAALDLRAVALLAAEFERIDPGAPRDWPAASAFAPHVAEVVESPALTEPAAVESALRLATRASETLMRVGDQTAATTLLDRALARFAGLGADHPGVLQARRTRAWMVAVDAGGDLRRAGQMLVGLLAETTDVLGSDDPTTLTVKDWLGWVRAEQGDLALGQALLDDVLRVRRRVLGDVHPSTLATRHRLAWITAGRGRPDLAAATLTEVLEARTAILGPEHLDVYSTRYRLAWALNEQGRHADAERTYRELTDDLDAVLGRAHPLTLMARGRLAWAVSWLNRYDDAEQIYDELLDDQQKVLGVDHPRVSTTGHYLAMLWLRRGRVADAEVRFREVAARREEVLGADHPLTLYSRSYHASAQFELGAVAEAERELQAVFADRVGVLGERHPETLTTRYLLARILLHRGRLGEAERRLRALLHDMTSVFPADHRMVLHTRVTLAIALGYQDDVLGADEMLREVIADAVRTFGAEHRDTLVARDGLCWALGRGQRLEEAARECAQVLAARRRTLGDDHPATLTSRYREAWIVLRQGRDVAARELFARLLADLRRTVGDRHPDTLRCRTRYVETLRLTARWTAASVGAEDLVVDLVAVLGEDAVETMRGREEVGRLALARGDTATARRILTEVLERRRRVLGDDHSDTLRSVEDVDDLP